MMLYNIDTKLCDVVLAEPSIITVINRFGILLGLGDKSIKEICESHCLDVNFFLTILNTYLNEDYFPEKVLKSFNVEKIINYLKKTNDYYQQYQLANIERHFDYLIMKSDFNDNNLHLLKTFFTELKQELLNRIDYDNNIWFPQLSKLSPIINESSNSDEIFLNGFNISESHPIEDKLNDLKSFFIIHLRGTYDQNLCYAVINAIFTLEKDIKQNNRIRDRILSPMSELLMPTKL